MDALDQNLFAKKQFVRLPLDNFCLGYFLHLKNLYLAVRNFLVLLNPRLNFEMKFLSFKLKIKLCGG
jgi:hypothetical protein